MHGQHQRLLQEEHIDQKTSLTWMKDSRLKRHTEAMVHAIQDQAVKIRYIEKNIYKTPENDKCGKCNEKAETIHHITSGCPKYANTLYLKRHNNVAKYLHLNSDLVKKKTVNDINMNLYQCLRMKISRYYGTLVCRLTRR